jgi:hypothetical protein
MGDPDKTDLQAELERAGWRVERRVGDDWWKHEVWGLASTWRPTHAKAFITLLVDPMSETSDIGSVSAIAITLEELTGRWEAGGSATIRVRPRWPERMKEIVLAANSLRPAS